MNGNSKQPQIVGIDTNIFIYHYQGNPEFVAYTNRFFNALIEEKFKAVTSIMTLVELLSFSGSDKEIEKIQDAFYSTPNLMVLPLENEIALLAARIRRIYNYRVPDSIQLATCLYAKANKFVTNDRRLKSFPEIKIEVIE